MMIGSFVETAEQEKAAGDKPKTSTALRFDEAAAIPCLLRQPLLWGFLKPVRREIFALEKWRMK